jgi:chaperone required for assembly of F1-ATPase
VKRFYREAGVAADDTGFRIVLDGRGARTPAKNPLAVPSHAAAEAIAAEWAAQVDELDPSAMRLCRLANTAIDRVAGHRAAVVAEVARFAETDLVCYRAAEPVELRRRQDAAWQPLVEWAVARYGTDLRVAEGIVPEPQAPDALAALRRAIEAFADFPLTALHAATAATGSLVIALAVAEGWIDGAKAFTAAHVDELYQAELWGEDAEAARRRAALRADIEAAARFLALTRG